MPFATIRPAPGPCRYLREVVGLISLLAVCAAAWANDAPGPSLADTAATLSATHPGQSGVRLLDTGADALRERDALIAAARHTIDAQYYIWNADASGRYVAARLLEAAGRGVRVRIILDDVNVAGRDATLAALAAHPLVEVRVYNPTAARSGVRRALNFLQDFSRLNRRMHNKSFTVDGAVSIIGGRNIGDEYFDLSPVVNFRDRELLVVGPVVPGIVASFEAFWQGHRTYLAESLPGARGTQSLQLDTIPDLLAAALREMQGRGYSPLADNATHSRQHVLPALVWAPARLVSDPPPGPEDIGESSREQPVAAALRELLATAGQEILVESAYLILGDESLSAARRLRDAGVRIRALTNSLASNDLVTNHSGYARRRTAMLDSGMDLSELRPDAAACRRLVTGLAGCDAAAFSLHSKSFVLDRRVVYVGSFNLNLRSAYLNSETALIVESPVLAAQVAASMEELMAPDSSWQVRRGPGSGLVWVTGRGDARVVTGHEPLTGAGRRFQSRFYRLFPLEKYL